MKERGRSGAKFKKSDKARTPGTRSQPINTLKVTM